MKTLLINPGETTGEGRAYGPLTSPHMVLAYLAAYLKARGEDVKIIEMPTYKMSHEDVFEAIKHYAPDVVGLTVRSFNIKSAYKIAVGVKKLSKNIQVVMGGSHATALPEHTLEECADIDAVVMAYGEETLYEIVTRVSKGYKEQKAFYEDVMGVTYRNGGGYIGNGDRPVIADLDALPFPDYGMYDLNKFGKMYFSDTGRFEREFSIFASRGCPFKCIFCMPHGGPGISRNRTTRSPENIVAEMEMNMEKFGAKTFNFNDSTFGINRKWVKEFCELLRKRGLHKKVHWSFETRADLASEELFIDTKEAGCNWVFAGFESGAKSVLEGMRKGITKEDIKKYIANARAAKVPYISASFVVGLPYENRQTCLETRELVRELELDSVGVNIAAVYPGTELFSMVDQGVGGIQWLPGARMNWDIYDRTRAHVRVNDLGPDDIEREANELRKVALRSAAKRNYFKQLRKSAMYFLYYCHADRPKLFHHIKQGIKNLLTAGI
ncbi:MAG: cobalamin B12-binding domain-containing protein [Elusimicrobia bacterium]|nr:cobalamin B12-binding domain-containing protein [Elusimicrobiota bacterium]